VAHAQKDYGFTAIRVEGGLLPPEYLQTINALNARSQANMDYGLTRSLNIKDEIGRYWRMASDLWSDYQERRKPLVAAISPSVITRVPVPFHWS
jgi:hypothetical protein